MRRSKHCKLLSTPSQVSVRLSWQVSRREAERGGPKYPRQRSVGRAGWCGGAAALAGGKERERERERERSIPKGR